MKRGLNLSNHSKNRTMHFNINVFVEVILDIRKFYSAATVVFAHPGDEYGDYGDLTITHLVHTSSKLLGKHYVVTLDVHFRRLWRSLRYYHRIVQPIVIVIMPTFESYLEFKKATDTYPMSFPVWFVLFLFTPGNDTHDHCQNPIGNPFNLRYDTQMLVLCNRADILQEWYSIKGRTTRIFDVAKWEDDKGFVPLTKLSLYDRRKDLNGTVLRTVTVKEKFAIFYVDRNQDVPISSTFGGNYVSSLYGKVLEELTQSLNFTLDIVSEVNEHGMWNPQNKTWSGAIGEIVSGRADFAIADMSMTSLRVRYVDFTLPLIISKSSLFFKEPELCGVKWFGYFQTFHIHTWAAIITVIASTPILLFLMKLCSKSQDNSNLSDNFLYIWGIFCQQALIEFPKYSSLRVAYFTIFLTAILIMAYYSAALVCFLTSCAHVLPFRTMDEFLNDGTYKLIVPRGGSDYDVVAASSEFYSVKMMTVMKQESELPMSLIDGFVQLCTEKKVAYFVLNALKKSVEMRIPCKLSSISTEKIDNLGLVLSKDNPYTAVINYHLQKFLDNGMMMRLKDMKYLMQQVENKAYEPVHVISVVPILAILCGGIILSVIVLIIETTYYRYKKTKLQSRIFYRSRKRPFVKK
ncbi:glutamate receptor 1-like isoform X2 [Pseudomyrmex gracilis]|uniref:glutamate receptor 1-like isoform X2 n=1 Tax=Pseudomyrmex gracilis TaxID=219809 RepID=UPI00099515A1|nr:glutamate receptor 1-like isoform X2 [Pseudomyrmex gracilis]